jgi:hypothetical protein
VYPPLQVLLATVLALAGAPVLWQRAVLTPAQASVPLHRLLLLQQGLMWVPELPQVLMK